MGARTSVELLLLSWPRALPSSFAFLPSAYVNCSFVPEYFSLPPGGGGDVLEKELLDGLERIHHLTVDDIGVHWYSSHTQLSSSALLCLQSTSYPPSALQNSARRTSDIGKWSDRVLFSLKVLRCVGCCDSTNSLSSNRIAHSMSEHAQIVFD